MRYPKTAVDLARHIIDFNPDDAKTYAYWTLPRAVATSSAALKQIPWPKNLAPKTVPLLKKPNDTDQLPPADCLVVTWTVAEGHALSDILTPDSRSDKDWYTYRRNYDSFYKSRIRNGAPAAEQPYLGIYMPTKIGSKKVLCFKSNLHLSQDGPKLPIKDLWNQMITETGAGEVITTGTAGAIGANVKLGDVVVGQSVMFDCNRTFKNSDFNRQRYTSKVPIRQKWLSQAEKTLLSVNADQLPLPVRTPVILSRPAKSVNKTGIVTTDFFAYDNTTNTYGLQGMGGAVEMGDAVLGLVCQELGSKSPGWLAVRNASDPQIDGNLSPADQVRQAGQIYERYGYWTSVASAIVCWALMAP